MTAEMGEARLSTKATEGNGKGSRQRKTVESFVPWKQSTPSDQRQGSAFASGSKAGSAIQKKEAQTVSSSFPSATSTSALLGQGSTALIESFANSTRVESGRRRQCALRGTEEQEPGEAIVGRQANISLTDETRKGRGSQSGLLSSQGQRGLPTAVDSPLQKLSRSTLQSTIRESKLDNSSMVSLNSEKGHVVEFGQTTQAVAGQCSGVHSAQRTLQSRNRVTEVIAGRRGFWTPTSVAENEEEWEGPIDEHDDGHCPIVGGLPENELQATGSHSDKENEEKQVESEDEGALAMRLEEIKNAKKPLKMQEITLAEETTKRRERRQAQALREKEGGRRKKEGLPRNFLLVDEYTKKPYGVGVGDWRKELMVLSKSLDPAIGNIKQQPEDAIEEIADWIQHTWEYSSPIKFAYVKEVIARGVTLRRADLWKKIRNEEPKPDGVSDRSWQILEKQLDSPPTVRKLESCRKANASRVNFGRTGPSGEVGVRQRLRRTLRRSPDPEEIRFEMARNKGYEGRYKKRKEEMNVVYNGEDVGHLAMHLPSIEGPSGNVNDNTTLRNDIGGHKVDEGNGRNVDSLPDGATTWNSSGGGVQAMSMVEVAQHPLVLKLMERLEVLERGHITAAEGGGMTMIDSFKPVTVQQGVHRERIHNIGAESQEGGDAEEDDGSNENLT